ncbi:MFS transporter [Gordoniibacillus kamchatkensis]|uniref:MFS transporter n=1 Tax=Gordoniibacillus kamchatkensis TaxID=1590651 RepID=UPI000A487B7F|nr:MFS transporter [Paenibacillus sp. VKM B-2647]
MPSGAQQTLAKSFTFSMYTMMAIVASCFPLYFDAVGYSKVQIGMLYSIGPMIGLVSNLLWGYLSDKWGTTRKVLLLLLLGQLALAPVAFHTHSFALLYLCMAFFFFFQQPMSSINDSQLLLLAAKTGKSYASFRVFGSIGFAAASLGFGLILARAGHGFTPYLVYASAACSLLIALALHDARRRGSFKPLELGPMVQIVRAPKFVRFLSLLLVLSIAHRMNDGFLALYMRQLHASDAIVGYAWTTSAVSEIPVFFLLSKFGHKFKELALLTIASAFYVLRFALLSFIADPAWVVAVQALHSVSFGIFLFTALRYFQQAVPDEYRSSGQAIFAVMWSSLAGLLSGVIGGWVFQHLGGEWLYRIAAVLALIAAFGFYLMHMKEERGEPVPSPRN